MPVVHPAELWRRSGRYDAIGPELARFKDRAGREMVIAMTHEEVVADLPPTSSGVYRQLPIIVYHFQTKFRDEPRSRGGLIRVREFVMKDAYSCDRDCAGLDAATSATTRPTSRIFERLGLDGDPRRVRRRDDGRHEAHEFMVLNPSGEDTLVLCDACGYAANRQVAHGRRPRPRAEAAAPVEDVETPDATTIDAPRRASSASPGRGPPRPPSS